MTGDDTPDLPDRRDPIVYWLLESARRIGNPDDAVARIDDAWRGVDAELRQAIRAAASGVWTERELYDAFMTATFEVGDDYIPIHERVESDAWTKAEEQGEDDGIENG